MGVQHRHVEVHARLQMCHVHAELHQEHILHRRASQGLLPAPALRHRPDVVSCLLSQLLYSAVPTIIKPSPAVGATSNSAA